MSLTSAELLRYQRQIALPQIGIAGQEKIRNARVLVVGAGGLGCPVLTYLAVAGVGTVKIADGDKVEVTNLHRQPIFTESDCGNLKVDEAASYLEARSSSTQIISVRDYVNVNNLHDLFADIDIVVDGTDNFSTKYLLNDACVELGKPLVSGSILGFEGQVSVFNAELGGGSKLRGPTYRCLFPEPPPANLVPTCAEGGVLGSLPGVVGCIQATETLKIIAGIGSTLVGRLLIFDALAMRFREVKFDRIEEIVSETRLRSPDYYEALRPKCHLDKMSISPKVLKGRIARGDKITLLDVREREEKLEYDIGGDLIPSGTVLANTHKIPRDHEVVVYCRSGIRSDRCIDLLRSNFGFSNLLNLEGGILAWQQLDREESNQ